MIAYPLAFLIAAVSGLRSFTAPAAVSWAARAGWLPLGDTWLSWLAAPATTYILTALALAELVADKLPFIPSRKDPGPFVFRIVSGVICGGAVGAAHGVMIGGVIAGVLGAVAGTLGGYEFRKRLVRAIGGKDLPIALLEDAIAVVTAGLVLYAAAV